MILDLLGWEFNVDIKATKTAIYTDVDCICPECRNLYFAIENKSPLPYELVRFLSKTSIPIRHFEHQSGAFNNDQVHYSLEYSFIGSIIKGEDSKKRDVKARKGKKAYCLNHQSIDRNFQIAATSTDTTSDIFKHLPDAPITKLHCNFTTDWLLKEAPPSAQ